MDTISIRKQLHNYLDVAEDEKVEAIYTMVKDDIVVDDEEYSEEFKAELDRRVEYYLNGGRMVTPAEMSEKLNQARNNRK